MEKFFIHSDPGKTGTLLFILVALSFFLLLACASKRLVSVERRIPPSEQKMVKKEAAQAVQYGIASWYGKDFHGKPTSSGEVYDMYQLTCAHNTFPLGTMVMVTHIENGKSVELKVNDRGPFVKDRIIDLSYAAAQIIGMYEKGTAYVKVEAIGPVVEQVERFTLQVGSFADEGNAQRLAEQLRKSFDNVHVTTMETLTQKYHRVRVGQFETREEALGTAEKLSQMGFKVLVTSR
jgi:rare lipoprotein A